MERDNPRDRFQVPLHPRQQNLGRLRLSRVGPKDDDVRNMRLNGTQEMSEADDSSQTTTTQEAKSTKSNEPPTAQPTS